MRRRPRFGPDEKAIAIYALFFALVIVWTCFYFVGPCSVLERLPMKDAPQRCLR